MSEHMKKGNKMQKSLLVGLLLLGAATTQANTGDSWYVGAGIGKSFNPSTPEAQIIPIVEAVDLQNNPAETWKIEYKNSSRADFVVGMKRDCMRYQLDVGYTNAKMKHLIDMNQTIGIPQALPGVVSGQTSILNVLASGLVDFNVHPKFSLYAGAGVGAGYYKTKLQLTDGFTRNTFAKKQEIRPMGAVMAGFRVPIAQHASINMGYRAQSSLLKVKAVTKRLVNHGASIGILFNV